MENFNRSQQWILTEAGLLELTTGILEVVNQRIEGSIVQEIGAESDDKHVPSAQAVYDYINAFPHMRTQLVRGDIDEVVPIEERSDKVIYVQAPIGLDWWSIYLWDVKNQHWIWLGDREVDLSNYWSKDEEDVLELKGRIGVDDLEDRVDSIEEGVDNIETINDLDLDRIIDQAIRDSEVIGDDDPVEPGEEEQDPNNSDPDNPDPDPDDPPEDEIMG